VEGCPAAKIARRLTDSSDQGWSSKPGSSPRSTTSASRFYEPSLSELHCSLLLFQTSSAIDDPTVLCRRREPKAALQHTEKHA
jgi:hypothetical protein